MSFLRLPKIPVISDYSLVQLKKEQKKTKQQTKPRLCETSSKMRPGYRNFNTLFIRDLQGKMRDPQIGPRISTEFQIFQQ